MLRGKAEVVVRGGGVGVVGRRLGEWHEDGDEWKVEEWGGG